VAGGSIKEEEDFEEISNKYYFYNIFSLTVNRWECQIH
jgi:hypothetical protein